MVLNEQKKMIKPKVTVVVPAYNEEKNIAQCLETLASQEVDYPYEVILVDNNSTDKTVQVAKKFLKKMPLKIISEKKQGRGAARAAGFKKALGEIICSADSDTFYPEDWIDTLVGELENSDAVAVSGTCRIEDRSPVTNKLFNFLQPNFMHSYKLIYGHYWLSGFNFAVYKKSYEKSGGFDPDVVAMEDIEISLKVSKVGKIKFINKPVVFSGRRFDKGLIFGLLEYVKGYTETIVLKKTDAELRNVR